MAEVCHAGWMDGGAEATATGRLEASPDEADRNAVGESGSPFTIYIPALDGVRGVAVLAVMLFHFQIYLQPDVWRLPLFQNGWFGVDLFFALSGFLITRTLRERRSRPRYWRTFLIRRALRILPPYILLLVVISPVIIGFHSDVPAWSYPLFMSNYWLAGTAAPVVVTITWSLSIEEQFYVLWPSMVRWLIPTRLMVVSGAIAGVSPLVRWWLHDPLNEVSYMWTICRLDALAWGAMAWILVELGPRRVARIASLVAPVGLVAMGMAFSQGRDLRADLWFAVFGYTTLSITASALLISVTSDPRSPLRSALEIAPLRHLGKVSYPAYLFHPLVASLVVVPLGFSWVLAMVVSTTVSWLVATLIHRTVEVPVLSRKTVLAP